MIRAIVDSAGAAIVALDTEGRVTFWNPAAQRIFGWKKEEVMGRFTPLVPKSEAAAFPDSLSPGRFQEREKDECERVLRTKNGETIHVGVSGSVLRDNEGGIIGRVEVIRDITEQKHSTAVLEEAKSRLQGILDHTPNYVYLKEAAGRFLFVNRRVEEHFPFTSRDVIGKTAYDLFPKDLADRFTANERKVLETGKPLYLEEALAFGGESRWYLTTIFPIRNAEGEITSLAGVSTDITEQEAARKALRYRHLYEQTLARISRAFIHDSTEGIEAGIQSALAELGAFCKSDRCVVVLFRSGEGTADETYSWCAEGISRETALRPGIPIKTTFPNLWKTLKTGAVYHIPNVASMPADETSEKKRFPEAGTRSLIAAPLLDRFAPAGFMVLDCVTETKEWTPDEIQMIRRVGEIIFTALARRTAEERLRESEERFALFMSHFPGPAWLYTPGGRFVYGNQLFYLNWNLSPEDIAGRPADAWIPNSKRELFDTQTRSVMEKGDAQVFEEQPFENGDDRILLTSRFPIFRKGKVAYIGALSIDITDRKRTEEILRRQRDLSIRLGASVDLATAAEHTLQAVLMFPEIDMGALFVIDPETERFRLIRKAGDFTTDFSEAATLLYGDSEFIGRVSRNKPIYLDIDLGPLTENPRRESFPGAQEGFQALAGLPLKDGKRFIGVLILASRSAGRIPLHTRYALESIAARVGGAVTRLMDRAQLEQEQSRLKTLVQLQTMRGATEREVADFILRRAIQLTGGKIGTLHFVDTHTGIGIPMARSENVLRLCSHSTLLKQFHIPEDGLLSKAIKKKAPVIINDFDQPLPKDHIPLRRLLIVPVLENDDPVALLLVGDKPAPFDENDARQLAFLMDGLWERIKASRTRRELAAAKESAESANRVKDMFMATITHELRTPLHGILGYAQILENNPRLTASDQEFVSGIISSGNHLLTLINDLLDFSNSRAGTLSLSHIAFDLAAELKRITALIDHRVREKGLAFHVDIGEGIPRRITGDPLRLRQVLLNLLGNAVKFTEAGSVRFSVSTRRLDRESVRLNFRVSDTGPGIAEDQFEKIFEPFHRIEQPGAEGTGLGLSISRQIIRLMGDDLHLRSRPGEGSKFYFSVVFQTDQTNEMVNSREFSKDRKPPPVITNASLPPKAQLQTLSEMARLGDITGILEMTRTLAAAGSDPAGFAETLHQMAKACRIEQLKRFLKTATDEKDEKKNP